MARDNERHQDRRVHRRHPARVARVAEAGDPFDKRDPGRRAFLARKRGTVRSCASPCECEPFRIGARGPMTGCVEVLDRSEPDVRDTRSVSRSNSSHLARRQMLGLAVHIGVELSDGDHPENVWDEVAVEITVLVEDRAGAGLVTDVTVDRSVGGLGLLFMLGVVTVPPLLALAGFNALRTRHSA